MAYNAYLKLEGITDVTGAQTPIEVLSFGFGVASSGEESRVGAGRVRFTDLTITKHVDVASAKLLQFAENGKRFGSGMIYTLPAVQSNGAAATPFLKVELSEILISSVQYSGHENGDIMPLEELTLNFLKIDLIVSPLNAT